MHLPKNTEKGFTLIELLVVVAILGVLAAVVVPNVGRFMGRGQTEAAATEKATIQTAVTAMMVDNNLSVLPNPVTVAENDMSVFPDTTVAGAAGKTTDYLGGTFTAADDDGWVLWNADINGGAGALVKYVQNQTTKGTYTVTADGTVTQVTTGY